MSAARYTTRRTHRPGRTHIIFLTLPLSERRRRRLQVKMGTLSGRLAATGSDAFGIFGSDLDSSNPLIEISLMVPFLAPTQLLMGY